MRPIFHGFDRLHLAGTLRTLYHPEVMQSYLRRSGVLWEDGGGIFGRGAGGTLELY